MEIKKLNSALIEKISGDFTMNTLTQCISELVLNSLDANSNAVAVLLNPITLKVQVVDNGDGISKESMDLVGERFHTSKYADPMELNTHGHRGQALATISKRSRSVTIRSRHKDSSHTFSKILGKSSSRDVRPARERPNWGTTVTVEGFFNCLQKKRITAEVVVEDVKQYLKELLLVYPVVWFRLRNDATNELILESLKQDDIVSRFRHLYPDVLDVELAVIKVSKDNTVVDALMGKELSKHKALQYFYFNKLPVHSNKLLKYVVDLFLNQKKHRGERQHPVFAINIKCPLAEVDLLLNSAKTTVEFKHDNLVTLCLEKLVCTLFDEKSSAIEARTQCNVSEIRSSVKTKETDNDSVSSKKRAKVVLNKSMKLSEKSLPDEKILSENLNDEERGKGLIMDMFIKSTQVFNREESEETVFEEESNVCFEMKSVTEMKKTTSMVVNVKSTRKLKKKHVKLCHTAVQTSPDMKDIKIPDEDFTIVLDNDKMTIAPKDPKHNQSMPVKALPSTSLLSPPPPHTYPTYDMRYSHFQQPYQTDQGCNRYCCLRPINPRCAPNFRNHLCRGRNDIARNFYAPPPMMNLCCKQMNCNTVQQFKQPQSELVRFMNCCNLGCGHDSKIARNFGAPDGRPRPTKFMNHHHLGCGYDNDYVVRSGPKNPRPYLHRLNNCCDLGYRNGNIDDLGYRHRDIYMTQNIPQTNSLRCNNNYTNFGITIPNVSNNCPEFENTRRNNAVDVLQTSKDLITTTKPTETLQEPTEFKSDCFHTRMREDIHQDQLITFNDNKDGRDSNSMNADKDEDNITEFTDKFLSTCKSQENLAEFNINVSNQSQEAATDFTRQDQLITCKNQRDVTKFHSSSMDADKDENNIAEFTEKCLSLCKSQENLAEFNTNVSNRSQEAITDCNPIFKGTNKDHDNVTTKLLSPINNLEDIDGFTPKDFSGKLLQEHQRDPLQIETSTNNQGKCTLTRDTNQEEEVAVAKESKLPKDWQRRRNVKGESFYVNMKTGFTLFCTPHLTQNQFKYEERLDLVPKGMSPILKEVTVKETLSQNTKTVLTNYIMDIHKYELPFIKWQKYLDNADPESFFEVIYMEKVKMFQSFLPKCTDIDILNDIVTFDKRLFDNFEVIGQVDKKFLAVRSLEENILVLFDQHAVHERIRLEALLKVYKNATSVLREPLLIKMKPDEVSLLKKFEGYLNSLGFYADFSKNAIKVTKVPLCLAKKTKTDPNHSLSNLMEYALMEICESLRLTRGVPASTLPQFIQGIISTEACRGAIKFGDVVSRKECERLVKELSKCDLPFQCAHGRPTVVPLVRLQSKIVTHKPNFKNLRLH